MWEAKLEWDTPIPNDLIPQANELIQQARYVNDVRIPRNVLSSDGPVELRIYCDANKEVVGVVAYVVTPMQLVFITNKPQYPSEVLSHL